MIVMFLATIAGVIASRLPKTLFNQAAQPNTGVRPPNITQRPPQKRPTNTPKPKPKPTKRPAYTPI